MPNVRTAIVVDVSEVRSHARERVAFELVGDACGDRNLFEPPSADVVEEEIGHCIVGDECIEEAVAVDIGESDSHSFAEERVDPGFVRYIRKCAITVVAIKGIVKRSVLVWMAVATHAFLQRAIWVLIDLPVAVVNDEKIEKAIIVVVKPACPNRPHLFAMRLRSGHTCFCGDFSECAIAVIVKELIACHVRNENVCATIVVVVTNSDSHAIACSGHACFFGDVGESTVMVVAIETVPVIRRSLPQRWYLCAVDRVDIKESIVVVIEQRNAGNHRFGLVLVRCGGVARDEVKSGLLRDLFEPDRWSEIRGRARLRHERPKVARTKRGGRKRGEGLEELAAWSARDVNRGHKRSRDCRESNQPLEGRLVRDRNLIRSHSFTTVIDRRLEKRRGI